MKRRISIAVLFLALLLPGQVSSAGPSFLFRDHAAVGAAAEKYYRTELYFGRSIPGGGMVSDQEWERFLAEVVTPRFPDGFTVLRGIGQYREKSGKIISEPSQILIFLYTRKMRKTSRAKIEEIRAAYVKRFSQDSVMRVDLSKSVDVSF